MYKNDYSSGWGSIVITDVKSTDYFISLMSDSLISRYTITVSRISKLDNLVSWYELHNAKEQIFSLTNS